MNHSILNMDDIYIPNNTEMKERKNIMDKMLDNNLDFYQLFELFNMLIPQEIKDGKQGYEIGCKRELAIIMYKQDITKNIVWGIPTIEAINEICLFVNNNKVLEVGAGTGLWTRLLQLKGVDIVATDIGGAGNYFDYNDKDYIFCNIDLINGMDAVEKYKDCEVLFLCWSPFTSLAYNVLKLFKGNKLIYIGEPEGGCTADSDFFKLLENEWVKISNISILQWNYARDKYGSGFFIRKLKI